MWNYGYGGFGFFPFFPFLWLIFWIFVVVFIFRGFRRGSRWHDHDEQSAEQILKERFAKGEIDEKEFKQRMDVLTEREQKK